jgi:CBS domain-containing protein
MIIINVSAPDVSNNSNIHMLVRDLMTKNVISVSTDTSVNDAARLLIENRIHGVPVIENNMPIGMVTEADLFTRGLTTIYLPGYIDTLKGDRMLGKLSSVEKEKMRSIMNIAVKDIMTAPCVAINEDADVKEILELMREKNLTSVPVVDERKNIAGIVTLFDVIHAASDCI